MSDSLRRCVNRLLVIRRVPARARTAWPRFAGRLLAAALVAVYFLLVTPIGVLRRGLRGRSLARPGAGGGRGWLPVRQSSSDKRMYLSDY